MTPDRTTVWRPDWPCPVGPILRPLRRGAGDPTYRIEGEDHWLGLGTPQGPAALHVRARTPAGEVHAEAWGPGAEWAINQVPALLGAEDDPGDFDASLHPLVEQMWQRLSQLRFGATGLVFQALVPAVIEQKVTGQEAFAGYRRIVRRFGERAPGPHPDLFVPPGPDVVRQIPSWSWLHAHIDGARSKPLMHASRVAPSLERIRTVDSETADRRLRSLPGIGVWTSAEVRSRALGDPDAVSFFDYHIAKNVTYALTGEKGDDADMERLLEPWAGQRNRVVVMVAASGLGPERHGPRMAPRRHLPVRGR